MLTSSFVLAGFGDTVRLVFFPPGIGFAPALRLDTLGFTVFAGCLQPSGEGAEKLKSSGSDNLHVVRLDVTSDHDVKEAIEYVQKLCPGRGNSG